MKKTIVAIVILGLVGALGFGYWTLRSNPINLEFLSGKAEPVTRGDLTIPINATGDIEPTRRVEIKSNASGEVIEVTKKAGQRITANETLILLKQEDEQRNVDRARADVKRAAAALEKAKQTLVDRKGASLDAARARVRMINPQIEMAEFIQEKVVTLRDDSLASREEVTRARTNLDQLKAQLASAEAELAAAEIAILLAEQDVVTADANQANAVAALGVAEKQLADTRVVSPIDGMVSLVNVHVGEVIQGGKTTFTGGTLLAVAAEVDRIYVKTEVDEADIGVVRELAPESARPQIAPAAASGDEHAPAPGGGDDDEVPISAGAKVRITVEAFHEDEFEGYIERIYPEPKKTSSVVTYIVDILITSANRDKLMLGMHADVEFTAKSVRDVVLVKHDAIRRGPDGTELGVFVPTVGANGRPGDPKFIKCRFGLDNGLYAEVIEGVKEGQKVYTQLPRKSESEEEREKSKSR